METTTKQESVTELLQAVGISENYSNPSIAFLHTGDTRYARDLKINLRNVLQSDLITEKEAALLALSIATNDKNAPLQQYFRQLAAEKGATEAEIAESVSVASLLAANNVLYRFRHFTNKEKYNQLPARIKMNIMMNPVLGKELFELASLVVSAVNGCEKCVNAHENSLIEMGTREERIFESIRIASVIQSLSKIVY